MSLSSFFEAVTHVGALPAGATWAQGWTCDSDTVSFNSGASCLDIPVFN